jgi:hypothetical protein
LSISGQCYSRRLILSGGERSRDCSSKKKKSSRKARKTEAEAEQRHLRLGGGLDNSLVSAAVVQAMRDQAMHALPAHVGEVHWRGGGGW